MTDAQKLAEAETALHRLMTGRSVVSVTKDGRSVTYTQADRADLERYITQLKTGGRRAPMGVR